jgi:hypothetical protein
MSWHRSMLFEVDQAGAPSVSNSPRSRIGATYRPPERHGAACGACSRGAPRSLGARRPLPRASLSTLKFFSNLSPLSSGEFLKVYFSSSVCKVRVGVGLLGFFSWAYIMWKDMPQKSTDFSSCFYVDYCYDHTPGWVLLDFYLQSAATVATYTTLLFYPKKKD